MIFYSEGKAKIEKKYYHFTFLLDRYVLYNIRALCNKILLCWQAQSRNIERTSKSSITSQSAFGSLSLSRSLSYTTIISPWEEKIYKWIFNHVFYEKCSRLWSNNNHVKRTAPRRGIDYNVHQIFFVMLDWLKVSPTKTEFHIFIILHSST